MPSLLNRDGRDKPGHDDVEGVMPGLVPDIPIGGMQSPLKRDGRDNHEQVRA
jgi:hypothetical protein